MNEEMDEILKRMGWTSGLHLPAANDENKALQQEVENLMLKKVKATALFRNEENRHKQLDKHLKFVNEQSQDNQVSKYTIYTVFMTSKQGLRACKTGRH